MKKNIKKNNKGNMVGFAIIGLAFLLLLGSITTTGGSSSSSSGSSNGNDKDDRIVNYDLTNDVLFQLNNTKFGEEMIKSTNYPNIKIGSSKIYDTIYERYDQKLVSSSFSQKGISVAIEDSVINSEDFLGVLVMAYPKGGLFEDSLGVLVNGKIHSVVRDSNKLPILISKSEFNSSNNNINLQLANVEWYQLASSKELLLNEVKVVAISKDSRFSSRTIDFLVSTEEEHLKNVQLKLSVVCPPGEDGSTPIEAFVNGFKVMSQNPKCVTSNNRGTILSAQIPLSVLKDSEEDEKNELLLETFGVYETSVQLEEVSFNDEYTYTFYLNSNRNLHDVIVFADFDQEALDVQLNSYRFSIPRKQTYSIKNKMRSGKNVFTIHETPVEIRELTIEQVNKK